MNKLKILVFNLIIFTTDIKTMDQYSPTFFDELTAIFDDLREDSSSEEILSVIRKGKNLYRTYTYDLIHALYSDLSPSIKKKMYKDVLKYIKGKALNSPEDIYIYLNQYANYYYSYMSLSEINLDSLDDKALVDANGKGCFMSYGTFKNLKLNGIYVCPTTRQAINIREPIFVRNLIGYMRKIKNRYKIDLDEFTLIDPVTNETLYTNLESAKRIIGIYTKSTNPKLLETSCDADRRFISIERLVELLNKI